MNLGERLRALRQARGWRLEDVSSRSGVEVGTLGALEARKSKRSEFTKQIAAGFGMTVDEFLGSDPSNSGLAQDVSHIPRTVVFPKRYKWEQVMAGVELGELFETEMPDDANAPEHPKGTVFVWSTQKQPQIGALVLLRVRGALYARKYRQGREPGHWIAAASNGDYASFDSADATLELVAVAKYREF
jgi:transcriptional regulator with XRE-family HTH domain